MRFDFGNEYLRAATVRGEPWFVAQDVVRCLGLSRDGGASRHLYHIPLKDQMTIKKRTSTGSLGKLFAEGHKCVGRISLVSEPGLYKLIIRSDKPAALKFQAWITDEVLPTIRKTGIYNLPVKADAPAGEAKDKKDWSQDIPGLLEVMKSIPEYVDALEGVHRAFGWDWELTSRMKVRSVEMRFGVNPLDLMGMVKVGCGEQLCVDEMR